MLKELHEESVAGYEGRRVAKGMPHAAQEKDDPWPDFWTIGAEQAILDTKDAVAEVVKLYVPDYQGARAGSNSCSDAGCMQLWSGRGIVPTSARRKPIG